MRHLKGKVFFYDMEKFWEKEDGRFDSGQRNDEKITILVDFTNPPNLSCIC